MDLRMEPPQQLGARVVRRDDHARGEERHAKMRDASAAKQQDAGVVQQVRPDELVRARVVELVDAEVPRAQVLLPHEIVGVALGDDVDVVRRAKLVDERRRVVERIGTIGRNGSEPGDANN
jgi:hypothetical protein